MAYAALAASPAVAPTLPSALVQRAIAALPSCYSQSLDNCLLETGGVRDPNCALINSAYKESAASFSNMSAAVKKLPFCESSNKTLLIGVGLGGLAAGVLLGILLR